jgi:DNA polymerase elongation subunit (family B)
MRRSRGAKAITKLAAEKGISVKEVRREIQIAIDAGMANQDPNVQAYWKKMIESGVKPTPEDVIEYIAKQAKEM